MMNLNSQTTAIHEPDSTTFYAGGSMAKCSHCGERIVWGRTDFMPEAAWLGVRGETKCEGKT